MQDFHPLTAAWFAGRFEDAAEPQRGAWPEVRAGRDVLISAPTGSGKTLAAFLICLDQLVARGIDVGSLDDQTEVVYVSPLKALSTDINRNLEAPLAEIASLATERGIALPPIRTAVRTGDTPTWEREQMVRRPPHLLVTTPESLFILLTAERGRRMLRTTRTIIVDEIHALVDDKRGSHLALTVARLDDLVRKSGGPRPQRIGLSATVNAIAEVAQFLSGTESEGRPPPTVVHSGHHRTLDLAVEVPKEDLGVVASNEMWGDIYDRMAELIRAHRTTLIFVNTRRLSERVAHHLQDRLGDDAVLAHHGSLSRRIRQTAERELKAGNLRAVVATASLELGIDIGSVDLVCHVGSPRSIGVALQRVGRSGHTVDRARLPKGRFFPTTRDELLECGALVRAMRRRLLDRLEIPDWPRDILAARGESRSYEGSTQSIRRTTLTRMAMGTRETDQPPLWIATSDLPTSPGHPFYARLTTLLDGHHVDRFVEGLCDRFYAPVMGRPSLAPGRYFCLLLVGSFEGIDSERGIAWRATDSLAVRSFLRVAVDEAPPDHSTIARTRRLIDLETHRTVFTWVQQRLVEAGRLTGKTIAIDATTLEANAAMRSIVRRDTGESDQAFLAGLATASGVETPTREGLARLDRKRKKKTSNTDWTHPHDPGACEGHEDERWPRRIWRNKAWSRPSTWIPTGAIVAVTNGKGPMRRTHLGDTTTSSSRRGPVAAVLATLGGLMESDVGSPRFRVASTLASMAEPDAQANATIGRDRLAATEQDIRRR